MSKKEVTYQDIVNHVASQFIGEQQETLSDRALPTPEAVELYNDIPKVTVKVKFLPNHNGLPLLKKGTLGSVGVDLYAALDEPIWLNTIGATSIVPTGISVSFPPGYEIQIRPRSGLSAKHGVTVLNSPGTIDPDYRGEIKVILVKLTTGKLEIPRGMRIAQMVVSPVVLPRFEYVINLDDTGRGEGGFGSTGE